MTDRPFRILAGLRVHGSRAAGLVGVCLVVVGILIMASWVFRERIVKNSGDRDGAVSVARRTPDGAASPAVPLSIPGLLERKGLETEQRRERAAIILQVPSGRRSADPRSAEGSGEARAGSGRAEAGAILAEHGSFVQLPIASLTKLMSTMVALDHGVDLDEEISILPEEFTVGGNLRIAPAHETVTLRELLYASITGSANNAALALARSTGLSREEFVREMNRKAIALGLEHLRFVDPSGLSSKNVGTAYEVARMAAIAFTEYPLIRDAASRGEYPIVTRNTKRKHVVKNPNLLLRRSPELFAGSKTGYLDEALYCLVLARETPGGLLIAVTLGHPSERGIEADTLAFLDEAAGRVAGVTNESGIRNQE